MEVSRDNSSPTIHIEHIPIPDVHIMKIFELKLYVLIWKSYLKHFWASFNPFHALKTLLREGKSIIMFEEQRIN